MIIDPCSFRLLVSGQSQGFWPGLQRGGLWAASLPYGWAIQLRNLLYHHRWLAHSRVSIPVISVGNLTLGGTGKTPCVEYLARFYRQRKLRVALLSRGYGSVAGRNDEALVLEENLPDVPHLQGADRVALAAVAIEELESELLILDDGFQHHRLARDLDLVLVDTTQPWGHGHLFPRGMLREPLGSLRRADLVLLTRCDQVNSEERKDLHREVARHAPAIPVIETVHRPREWVNSEKQTSPLEKFQQTPVAAFCGIGNPEAFHRTLQALGMIPCDFLAFPDHHAYDRKDVEDLGRWLQGFPKDTVAVTTQKDLVKLRITHLAGRELWALRIGLHVEVGQETLDQQLGTVLPISSGRVS